MAEEELTAGGLGLCAEQAFENVPTSLEMRLQDLRQELDRPKARTPSHRNHRSREGLGHGWEHNVQECPSHIPCIKEYVFGDFLKTYNFNLQFNIDTYHE